MEASSKTLSVSREQYLSRLKDIVTEAAINAHDGIYFFGTENKPMKHTESILARAFKAQTANSKFGRAVSIDFAIASVMLEIMRLVNEEGKIFNDVNLVPIAGKISASRGLVTLSFSQIVERAVETSRRKSGDYATAGDPFKNFRASEKYGIGVDTSLVCRIAEKISRHDVLVSTGTENVKDESLVDTMVDLVNYLAILLMYWELTGEVDREESPPGALKGPRKRC